MSVPQTSNDVVRKLAELARQLDTVTAAANETDIDATRKKEAVKLAEARAFIAAEGSVDLRKSKAIVETHQMRLEAEVAEATLRGYVRTIKTLSIRIDVGRTYGVTIRSEVALSGQGVHGA